MRTGPITYKDALDRCLVWLPNGDVGELIYVSPNGRRARVRLHTGHGGAYHRNLMTADLNRVRTTTQEISHAHPSPTAPPPLPRV